MSHSIPPGYMTAEEIRVGVHADIEENAKHMRERMTRINAYRKAYLDHIGV